MTDKATKGEWRYNWHEWLVECNGKVVADIETKGIQEDEVNANGRLMAASKDLAQALERLVNESSDDNHRIAFARAGAQAALRKAGVL